MASTDIDGTPILILRLPDVKALHQLLDMPETPDQNRVVERLVEFINEPECVAWESKDAEPF